MDLVVRFAFDELDALVLKRGSEFLKCLVEELREQEETGSLVEALCRACQEICLKWLVAGVEAQQEKKKKGKEKLN